MAITSGLSFTCNIGGARLHTYRYTGDGTIKRLDTGLERIVTLWANNVNDTATVNSGTSITWSGASIIFTVAPTSGKSWHVFVIGE